MPKREPITHADKLYNKRYDKETQLYWIGELEDNQDKLSSWESSFVSSIQDQLNKGKTLSEKQIDVLEKIYNSLD